MDAAAVVGAYHDLWQVEKSFRMAKSDLRAWPIFDSERDAIEARLTVVFAALAVSRHLQDATRASIKNLVRTLRPLRTIRIDVGGHSITAAPQITPEARALLERLPAINAPGPLNLCNSGRMISWPSSRMVAERTARRVRTIWRVIGWTAIPHHMFRLCRAPVAFTTGVCPTGAHVVPAW